MNSLGPTNCRKIALYCPTALGNPDNMTLEQNAITQSIFELEKCYLHQNRSKFWENFNDIAKYALICKFATPYRNILPMGFRVWKYTLLFCMPMKNSRTKMSLGSHQLLKPNFDDISSLKYALRIHFHLYMYLNSCVVIPLALLDLTEWLSIILLSVFLILLIYIMYPILSIVAVAE